MKWFKHDTNAMNDPRVRLLRVKFGMEAYGVYFGLLEMIASQVTESTPPAEWGLLSDIYDIDFLSAELRIEKKKLMTILSYMAEIGLIDEKLWETSRIANFKILSRADEYSQKLLKKSKKNRDSVGSESGVNRDSVGSEPVKKRKNVGLDIEREEEVEEEIIIPPTPLLKRETPEDRIDVKTIDELVEHLQRKHPGYRKRWSLEGIVKFRQVVSQKIEDGWTPDELHCHIEYYRPGCEGYSLFEIFDKKHQDRPSFGPYLAHKTQEELDKWIHSATH